MRLLCDFNHFDYIINTWQDKNNKNQVNIAYANLVPSVIILQEKIEVADIKNIRFELDVYFERERLQNKSYTTYKTWNIIF